MILKHPLITSFNRPIILFVPSSDEHDRLALMAYVEASRVHLPSYEEATRQGNSCAPGRGVSVGGAAAGSGPSFDYCSSNSSSGVPDNHQFYLQNRQYNPAQARLGGIAGLNDGNNNSAGNQHSTAAPSGACGSGPTTHMYRDGVSVSEMFGSIDTVNVSMSDASTSVTVETYDSSTCGRSVGSSSQQATAGSLQSSHDQLADDGN